MKRGKNMIASVKKCIDNGDIIGLRYIFLDSLDIDPTFEKYKDDYHFCEKLAGMFEPYIELTPLSSSQLDWNIDYWNKIKFDQKKNFSKERFEYMIDIAKVVHAKKIKRLLAERAQKQKNNEQDKQLLSNRNSQPILQNQFKQSSGLVSKNVESSSICNESNEGYILESDQRKIQEKKKEIALNNKKQEELLKQKKREVRSKNLEISKTSRREKRELKKVLGIAAMITIFVVIVVVAILSMKK